MKAVFGLLLIVMMLSCTTQAESKNVLMMVAEGFYAPEYFVPLEAFEKAGFRITTATKYKRAILPDERQLTTYPAISGDITFEDINVSNYDAIVFAGGNGAWEDFFPNEKVHKVVTEFMIAKKLVAMLCSSTGLLGVTNNLSEDGEPIAQGRNVTGYKTVKGLLTKMGKVNYSEGDKDFPYVVVDGNLITGRDPSSSELFAKRVIEYLK